MKDKIIMFIIGLLLGAVIATGAFYVYNKSSKCNCNQQMQTPGGTPPSMSSNENGQPPEKPSDNTENSTSTEQNN